jgi:AcrR family transcriptional regulator
VPRRRLYSDEEILDAARDLLIQGGPEAATTGAISTTSGVPIGSIYHRFGSRSQLFAQIWLRTVRRFQDGLLAAAASGSGIDRALAVADWSVEFAVRHPHDARLLLQARREDLLDDADLPAPTRQALTALNDPVTELLHRLAVDLFGTATSQHLELLAIAVADVPYAFLRRHLHSGTSPAAHRHLILTTVRTLLETSPGPQRSLTPGGPPDAD